MSKTYTKGNVIVEDIKIGDIHYEYEYHCGVKSQVITAPRCIDDLWKWTSKNLTTGEDIHYSVKKGMAQYSPNLYDNEAYDCNKWV